MQRRTLLGAILALAVLFAAGCGGVDRGARKAADRFTHAFIVDFDLDGMEEMMVGLGKDDVLHIKQIMDTQEYHEARMQIAGLKLGYKYDKKKSWSKGNTAAIYYDVRSETVPSYRDKPMVNLRRIRGQWKVIYYEFAL